MKLGALVCLCLVTRCGITAAGGNDPDPERSVLKDRSGENIPGAAPKPPLTILDETKDWVLLQCEVRGTPEPKVEWQDSDGNLLPTEKLQFSERGGHLYFTLNATVTRTDRYRCVATQEDIGHQIYTEIFVRMNGAAPKPSLTTLDQTRDWSRLQCEVHGNPEPKVEWQDSDGNILPAEKTQVPKSEGSFYVILQTTVTKTGRYRCVATQETINHQIYADTHVFIESTGLIVAAVLGAVIFAGGVLLAVLVRSGYIEIKIGK